MEEVGTLVKRSLSGDLHTFGRLVSRFQDMACGYAYTILGDFHLAEDAAQEAFVEAFRKLGQLREPDAFPGWFRRLVHTQCHRMTRRKTPSTLQAELELPAHTPGPSEALAAAELKESVLAAIRALPEHERAVTTLFYINGYSQQDIAGFLEVPVTTVKSRLHTSRGRLKERMMKMVGDTLKSHAPDERFQRQVINRLLTRPNFLEIPDHPVREAWLAIRRAFPEYEVVEGAEIEDKGTVALAEDNAWELAYRIDKSHALRYQTSTVTMSTLVGRTPPVRLLAAGRAFRPCRENATHTNVFHQVDGVCVADGVSLEQFKAACERVLHSVLPEAAVSWREHAYGLVAPGFDAHVEVNGKPLPALGGGIIKPETLRRKGYDPDRVSGFAWGLGLDRLAMLKHGIEDLRQLGRPPFVPKD